jgi:hypothetical protein
MLFYNQNTTVIDASLYGKKERQADNIIFTAIMYYSIAITHGSKTMLIKW